MEEEIARLRKENAELRAQLKYMPETTTIYRIDFWNKQRLSDIEEFIDKCRADGKHYLTSCTFDDLAKKTPFMFNGSTDIYIKCCSQYYIIHDVINNKWRLQETGLY